MLKNLVVVAFCFAYSAFAQTGDPVAPFDSPTKAPLQMPGGCSSAELINLTSIQGSSAFKLLRHVLSAAALGHAATQEMMAGMPPVKNESSFVHEIMKTNINLNSAEKTYLCGSFLMGRFSSSDSDQIVARDLMISVLNRMYLQTVNVQKLLNVQAEEVESGRQLSQVSFATGMSETLSDRQDTGTDLNLAIKLAYMTSVDMSGPQDGGTPFLNSNCNERTRVISDASELAQEKLVDEFTRQAQFLKKLLEARSCHR